MNLKYNCSFILRCLYSYFEIKYFETLMIIQCFRDFISEMLLSGLVVFDKHINTTNFDHKHACHPKKNYTLFRYNSLIHV